ncbi:RNA-directed DNA polymerase [Staphylococcus epidermidis]|uniref:RNA-directed DNA polymerase n=1 Tax=Staphylococcus epidermidis TaxID=1282 RepID=UPI0020065F93|nr:RNA-directed DNA polymerase [Staphylococcus epidermidis]MCK6120678.1 RNA-directed DNA polymerase [Staphylococcus epidermidis]
MKSKKSLEKLYDDLFSTNFLINYGYFDITPKNNQDITDLNSYGKSDAFYLKIFNMSKLAEYISDNPFYTMKMFNDKKVYSTEPITFTIPKSNISRREYKIPNIYSYLNLMFFIQKNKEEFKRIFLANKFSTSKFFSLADFDFKFTDNLKKTLLFGGNHILNVDLSNFYHSLYTHSIPWVIMGKKNAKKERDKGFSNKLDKLIASCQYNQTHGIPTGNILSRIISELYMCYIDSEMENKGYRYARYVDDISFPFNFEEEKDKFYRDFNKLCMKYELKINDKKTEINDFPYIHTQNKDFIFNYFKNYSSDSKEETWIIGIKNFIDLCIDEERKVNKGAIKCIFPVIENTFKYKKINKNKISKIFGYTNNITKFNILQFILDLSLKDSKLTNRCLSLLNYLAVKMDDKKVVSKQVKQYFRNRNEEIKNLLVFYNKNDYHQETYQILVYIVEYDVDILLKKNVLNLLNENTDNLSLSLLTIIYLRKPWRIESLLKKIDDLFKNSKDSYPEKIGVMSQNLWYFRYFIYYLIKENVIPKDKINSYCNSQSYRSNQKGYKSDLNWRYINSNDAVDEFFNELLEEKVPLIDLEYVNLI